MKLFLLYQVLEDDAALPSPQTTADRLSALFSQVYHGLSEASIRENRAGTLIYLTMPVKACRANFIEEDAERWVMAPDYPVDASRILASTGVQPRNGSTLPDLCRELERNPETRLAELAPPFSLIWSSKDTDEFQVQNDGLGGAQLFEYRSKGIWALSNRPFAFQALGLRLDPDPVQWAVRWTVRYFVGNISGFRDVRFLPAATRIRLKPGKVEHESWDVLSRWVRGPRLDWDDAVELGREAIEEQVRAGLALFEQPHLGMSGGRDSRLLASTLLKQGVSFQGNVRGHPWHPDVILATRLAEQEGIPLEVRSPGNKLPPDSAEGCREAIRRGLLLFAGGRAARSYKVSLAGNRRLRVGSVSLTGHGGEIAHDDHYFDRRWENRRRSRESDPIFRALMRRIPFVKRTMQDAVADEVLRICQEVDRYGLTGGARFAFAYLCNRQRRFIGSHTAARTGLEVMPLQAPGFIQACFSVSAEEKAEYAFHKAILARNKPEWSDIPYAYEIKQEAEALKKRMEARELAIHEAEAPSDWKRAEARHAYTNTDYWSSIGWPLIEACLGRDGFWREIFDPDAARTKWQRAPDELIITDLLPEMAEAKH